jgi:hypothetical protein
MHCKSMEWSGVRRRLHTGDGAESQVALALKPLDLDSGSSRSATPKAHR